VLGGWFLAGAWRVRRGGTAPMRLFHQSIAYLTLIFALIALTALLPFGRW
jgi:heme O synthase-like polyprenyltransferase